LGPGIDPDCDVIAFRYGAGMSSFLESPTVRQRIARHSVDAYHTLSEMGLVSERTELLRGVIVEKMTKTPLHVFVVNKLYEKARAAAPAGYLVRKEEPLTLADSEPEPDIAIVEGTDDAFRSRHPGSALLAIEVSISTEDVDREKAALYAEAGVLEYWLVLPLSGTVEVYSRPVGSSYLERRVAVRGDVLVSHSVPALRIDLDALFG
jgi:Uma2 family endonuclease